MPFTFTLHCWRSAWFGISGLKFINQEGKLYIYTAYIYIYFHVKFTHIQHTLNVSQHWCCGSLDTMCDGLAAGPYLKASCYTLWVVLDGVKQLFNILSLWIFCIMDVGCWRCYVAPIDVAIKLIIMCELINWLTNHKSYRRKQGHCSPDLVYAVWAISPLFTCTCSIDCSIIKGVLYLKPPKFEHIFVAVITFSPFLLCRYFWYQLVAYCVCFKMICKKSL